ncbi:MAG: DNA polymerase III subunit beta [Acidobacteria bacterium]|nr:DNA polymerase III subunit beta [Acidobacteriota bacterium]
MEFTVSKADLVRELNLSQGVVEKKTTIPILSNVLLEVAGDRLSLTATDLELGIRCGAPAGVKSGGAGTIPAKKLLDYVRLLPDGEVGFKFSDNHWATITCGRSRTRIAGMSRESYPELPQMPAPLAQLPIGLLASMIAKTIFAISAEESRFTLNGALLVLGEKSVTLVATDGHRLALVECENPLPGGATYKALLPRKAMGEILKLASDAEDKSAALDFAGDDNHLFFQLGSRLLISRKLTGNFPDFERVLPKSHTHSVEMDREEFRAAIERVSQFADERSRAIKVRFADNEATIHSSLSESGESEESLAVEYGGPTVEIGFNAQYLLEFLRAVPEGKVAFHFKDAQSAGELTPAGEGVDYKYRYVVMPMRI